MLALYSRDFVAAWREALGKLRLKKLLTDKPNYVVLSALGAPNSPLKQIFISIGEETMLTRERAPAAPTGGAANAADKNAGKPVPGLFTTGNGAPGSTIEAVFRPFHAALEGGAGKAPIDDIVSTLNEIAQNLILSATTPSQTSRANVALQEQISKLRNSTTRLPSPFSDMLRGAVAEFEGAVDSSTAGQILVALRDQVTATCQETTVGRYPFARGSEREVSLADFSRVFSPNGVMDKFFTQYLAPHADTSKREWTWRQGAAVTAYLSPSTLREFQRAAEIRDAFFQTGGNAPVVSLAMRPPVLTGAVAKFETGGTVVSAPSVPAPSAASPLPGSTPPPAPPPRVSPTTVQWPGAATRTAITVVADGGGAPSVLDRNGPWSLFRMLEAGSMSLRGDTATANYIVGGRELRYQITTGSIRNPLNLAVLHEFRCPSGI
jgi:type VI secretion system protein ImpL